MDVHEHCENEVYDLQRCLFLLGRVHFHDDLRNTPQPQNLQDSQEVKERYVDEELIQRDCGEDVDVKVHAFDIVNRNVLGIHILFSRDWIDQRCSEVQNDVQDEDDVDQTVNRQVRWMIELVGCEGELQWDLDRLVDGQHDDYHVPPEAIDALRLDDRRRILLVVEHGSGNREIEVVLFPDRYPRPLFVIFIARYVLKFDVLELAPVFVHFLMIDWRDELDFID